jgi:hypothetical protein
MTRPVPGSPRRPALRMPAALVALLILLPTLLPGTALAQTASRPRVEISPGAVLMTQPGERRALNARAFRANGRPALGGRIRWTSSNPAVVAVDANGVITAQAALGSAVITAQRYSVRSAPLLVTIAQPAPGARLVDDARLLSPIEPLDPTAPLGVGARYRVVLDRSETPPAIGSIVLGSGSAVLAGRVVAVEDRIDGQRLTLEVVPLPELFARIELPKSIDLADADVLIPPEVAADFNVRRLDDGTWRYTPREFNKVYTVDAEAGADGGAPAAAAPSRFTARSSAQTTAAAAAATGSRAIGPFTCEAKGLPMPSATLRDVRFDIKPAFRLVLDQDPRTGLLSKLALVGAVDASFNSELTLGGTLEAALTCRKELLQFVIPVGGPLALVFGGFVPVGAGFELGGKLNVSGIGLRSALTLGANVELGFACPQTGVCGPIGNFTPSFDGDHQLIVPPVSAAAVKVEPSAWAFAFADLSFGARLLPALRFQPFGAAVGPKLAGSFARPLTQILDPAYASKYEATLEFAIESSAQLTGFLAQLGLSAFPLKLGASIPLATSPKGLLAKTDVGRYKSGETVRFIIDLDPNSTDFAFLGNNVGRVAIYSGSEELVSTAGVAGRSRYELSWQAPTDGEINAPRQPTRAFAAFVVPRVVPSPVPLEASPVEKGTKGGTSRYFGIRDGCTPQPQFPDMCKAWVERMESPNELRVYYGFNPESYTFQFGTGSGVVGKAPRWNYIAIPARFLNGSPITEVDYHSESIHGPGDAFSRERATTVDNCFRIDLDADGKLLGFTTIGPFTLEQCNPALAARYTLIPDDGRNPWLPPFVAACVPEENRPCLGAPVPVEP